MVSDNRQAAISSKMKLAGKEMHRLCKTDAYFFKQGLLHAPQRRQRLKTLRELRKKLRLLIHTKSTQFTRATILFLRKIIRFMEKLYPAARGIATGAVMLGMIAGSSGCSGDGSSSGTDPPQDNQLTLAQRIEKAQAEALTKGCTIVDTNTNYSILPGGQNSDGTNYISEQGDKEGKLDTVPGNLTIKCNNQIFNFVFDDNTIQSDYVKDSNTNPVGDINEFFKTDIKKEADLKTFIGEKADGTSLCRFSEFPSFTGAIDDDTPEYMSAKADGKNCGNIEWYVNGSSSPAGIGNAFVAGIGKLAAGENDITLKVMNPAGTNSLYLKRTQGAAVNDPATAIDAYMTPSEIHTTTPSISCLHKNVVDNDGNTRIVTAIYDNNVLQSTGAVTYSGPFVKGHKITCRKIADNNVEDSVEATVINNPATAVTASISPADIYATTPQITCTGTATDSDGDTSIVNELYINGVPKGTNGIYTGAVNWKDAILCKSTADGVVTNSVSTGVKPSPCTIQFTSCYPGSCAIPSSYNESVAPLTIDAIVTGADQVIPGVSGEVPAGVTVTPSTNRVNYSGTPAVGTGGYNDTIKSYTTTVSGSSCSGSATINIRGPPVVTPPPPPPPHLL